MDLTQIFEEIRPYNNEETREALQRIIKDPLFFRITAYFFPGVSKDEIIEKINNIKTVLDWQVAFMHPIINSIVDKTSDGLTWSGFDKLKPGQPYLFISNHRDILLDSAILQVLLYDHGCETSQITFGNNLMETDFIRDVGKINKMFTVVRDSGGKEFYQNSKYLSSYIREVIKQKHSVWIAQRNGRTKDGDDKTHTGLLKMLNISGNSNFIENFRDLNIVPMTVSYEYEPCDFYKIRETYLSEKGEYIKHRGEDIESIVNGIMQKKGKIHLALAESINNKLDVLKDFKTENDKIKKLAALIDEEIYKNYKLRPVNYLAADMLKNSTDYSGYYDENQKKSFNDYIDLMINKIPGNQMVIKKLFLILYANPVFNFENLKSK